MSEKNKNEWIIGAEYCAYDIIGKNIVGIKFVRILDKTKTKIIGRIWERYRYRTIEFSNKTGKEYRGHDKYYWLTLRKKIERSIYEKSTNRNSKNRRLDSTNGGKAFRNPVIIDMEKRMEALHKIAQQLRQNLKKEE
jgi:hypothetical protein